MDWRMLLLLLVLGGAVVVKVLLTSPAAVYEGGILLGWDANGNFITDCGDCEVNVTVLTSEFP